MQPSNHCRCVELEKDSTQNSSCVSWPQRDCMGAEEIQRHGCTMWKWLSAQPSVPRPILSSHIDVAHEAVAATGLFCGAQQRFSALQQQSEDSKSYALRNFSHTLSSEVSKGTSPKAVNLTHTTGKGWRFSAQAPDCISRYCHSFNWSVLCLC